MKKETAVIPKFSIRAGAAAAALALVLSACGSSSGAGGGSAMGPGFDLASKQVLNASTKTGGTINLVSSQSFDSIDPGVTYSAQTWNLFRMFARPMMAYEHTPGGNQIVGDLATGPGVQSNGGKSWTYTLRDNATFEDGTPITSGDVRWAIERSNWSSLVGNGPTYFHNILTPPNDPRFTDLDVYKSGDKMFDNIIVTTDPKKITFNLPQAFGEFDYVMTMLQTAPVERTVDEKDSGDTYGKRPVSTGAYKIASYSPGKELKLVRNAAYNQQSDPNHMHTSLADAVDVQLGVDSGERDQELLDGQADADLGSALTVANHAKVLQDPTLKSQTDDAPDYSIAYSSINTELIPDVPCRQAIEYAVDKNTVLNQLGGQWGGTVATNLLTAGIPGAVQFPTYTYDPAKAKTLLATCKTADPALFDSSGALTFKIAAQTNAPDLQNAATAIQASLAGVGISTQVTLFPFGQYSQYCGNQAYAKAHRLGMCLANWGPDWLTGYGMLDQLVTSNGIAATGSQNYAFLNDTTVNSLEKEALSSFEPSTQQQDWVKIDHRVMDLAAYVPLMDRHIMRFRSAKLSNVMIDQAGSGGYDLSVLGLK
ncbi:extracellular solute-binding protein family 5 [Catenulispora acidiphila DSM 44928]|uniref:Extracellular solute-binding protein family 5 n=1 Tax=Catenulispora acidiphila (strain DSM 44928 / JCM 14897 / NBRC 102108 / NRRL B-24433 / ID139908) TaxID=479433 RepID=C7Q7C3_CATAD|nr:ABC transporter substrate-binding protein [Catenulispora acidiphila]ACU70211.1 extracellular solute-binding protein family 5 [Catenulispora acidiphila DSM 44928]